MRRVIFVLCLCLAAGLVLTSQEVPVGSLNLKVEFRGADAPRAIVQAIDELRKWGLLRTRVTKARSGGLFAESFADEIELPANTPGLAELAVAFNPKAPTSVRLGHAFEVPSVDVDKETTVSTYDPKETDRVAQIKADWGANAEIRPVYSRAGLIKTQVRTVSYTLDILAPNREVKDYIRGILRGSLDVADSSFRPETPPELLLVIRLEGGDWVANAHRVLRELVKADIVELNTELVAQGETVDGIYRRELNLPASLVALASELNRKEYAKTGAANGEEIQVPRASFTDYTFHRVLDREDKEFYGQEQTIKRENAGIVPVQEKYGLLTYALTGYQLKVAASTRPALDRARKQIEALRSPHVQVFFPEAKRKAVELYGSRVPMEQFASAMEDLGETDVGTLGWTGSYLRLADPLPPEVPLDNYPHVYLLDSPIGRHWNLQAAVGFTPPVSEQASKGRVKIRKAASNNEKQSAFHGTHMAGLLVGGKSESGLLGLMAGARFHPWDWLQLETEQFRLIELMDMDAGDSFHNSLVVMASSWDPSPDLEGKIKEAPMLWVVAAGQSNQNIAAGFPKGPMRLGNLRNMIVVTACDPCDGPGAKLLPEANFSTTGLVHVAAPGKGILSTFPEDRFGRLDGTSPASALTGGLVAMMMAKQPALAARQAAVKIRLQATSTPWLGADSTKLAAGVIDAQKALLDPRKDYLDRHGSLVPEQIEGWCVDELPFVNSQGRKQNVPVEGIIRLVSDGSRWWGFTVEDSTTGKIEKFGPLKWNGPDERVLRIRENGQPKTVKISDFTDVLLDLRMRFEASTTCNAN